MKPHFLYLGHAGFLIYNSNDAILIDPWLSDDGAFSSGWFQWPPNQHLLDTVISIIRDKRLMIYLTHEHEDHFDIKTLRNILKGKECDIVIPKYRDRYFYDLVLSISSNNNIITLDDNETYKSNSISLRIFIDDLGLNHDK